MSRHHPALAVVVRVTATLPHLTVVRVRQLSRKAQSCAPFLWCCNLSERPSCSKQPESVGPVCSAVWSNPIVIPNQVGFVRLSQIGVFVDGCKTKGCDGNLVPVAVKSTRLGGGLSVFFGCDGCKVKWAPLPSMSMDLPAIMISVCVCASRIYCCRLHSCCVLQDIAKCSGYECCASK